MTHGLTRYHSLNPILLLSFAEQVVSAFSPNLKRYKGPPKNFGGPFLWMHWLFGIFWHRLVSETLKGKGHELYRSHRCYDGGRQRHCGATDQHAGQPAWGSVHPVGATAANHCYHSAGRQLPSSARQQYSGSRGSRKPSRAKHKLSGAKCSPTGG